MSKFPIDSSKDIFSAAMEKTDRHPFARLLYQLSLRLNSFSRSIEAFLIQQSLRRAGLLHIEHIQTYTSKRELRTLYELAITSPQGAKALEIGAYLGASSCYLAAGLAQLGGQLICVDTWQNDAMPDEREDTLAAFLRNIHPLRHVITPLRKNSRDLTLTDIQNHFDLIFIDGDHSYEAAGSDFAIVQPWLTSGGIIAFHDFSPRDHEGVTRVVGEALASGDWILAGLIDSLAWIKRAHWRPSDSPR